VNINIVVTTDEEPKSNNNNNNNNDNKEYNNIITTINNNEDNRLQTETKPILPRSSTAKSIVYKPKQTRFNSVKDIKEVVKEVNATSNIQRKEKQENVKEKQEKDKEEEEEEKKSPTINYNNNNKLESSIVEEIASINLDVSPTSAKVALKKSNSSVGYLRMTLLSKFHPRKQL
jgi:thiamine pyrophosphate-dependent acetolactate synthase large subunit-like protein